MAQSNRWNRQNRNFRLCSGMTHISMNNTVWLIYYNVGNTWRHCVRWITRSGQWNWKRRWVIAPKNFWSNSKSLLSGYSQSCSDEIGVIESVKSVSAIVAPVSGIVTAVNEALADEPDLVNREPLEEGKLCFLFIF